MSTRPRYGSPASSSKSQKVGDVLEAAVQPAPLTARQTFRCSDTALGITTHETGTFVKGNPHWINIDRTLTSMKQGGGIFEIDKKEKPALLTRTCLLEEVFFGTNY